MHKKLIQAAGAPTALLLPLAGHAQTTQTYAANGQSGFSGFLGLGSATVSESPAGDITFAQTVGGPNGPSLDGNVTVFYIDSVAGGFSDTSTFTDTGGTTMNADHVAISGFNSSNQREMVTFAPGFQADYAVAFQDGYLDLFQLVSGDTLTYLTGIGHNGGDPLSFTFPASSIGLSATQGFSFVGTMTASNAYRSNEAIGDIGNVTSNPGFGSAITFNNFETFAPAPEPSGGLALLVGAAVLGGSILIRRRRQTA
jgi:hypothetical protein